jgi:hypothetical protein
LWAVQPRDQIRIYRHPQGGVFANPVKRLKEKVMMKLPGQLGLVIAAAVTLLDRPGTKETTMFRFVPSMLVAGGLVIALALASTTASAANATTSCDFKGLSVGDHATPQQIMANFGVVSYKDKTIPAPPKTKEEKDKDFAAQMERAGKVGLMNAQEEQDWQVGPACDSSSCQIPYGSITVGEKPYPIMVGALVSFDNTSKITSIDVIYSRDDWDEVRALINTKYGDNWDNEETQDVTTYYDTKESFIDTVTVLKHRLNGTNPKTGDTCSIKAVSRDLVFAHTIPPILRAILEIKMVSRNF